MKIEGEEKQKRFMETYKKIRKPMPPSEKVIPNLKDERRKKKFDWKSAVDNTEDEGEDYKSISEQKEGDKNAP